MLQLKLILLASAVFAFCESAAVFAKIGKKCSLSDDACMQDVFRAVFQEIAENGIPEMDIPKLDPIIIKNKEIDALGMIKFIMTDGEAKGFKSCYAEEFKADVEHLRTTIDFVCDLFSVEGNYKIESSPALLGLIGGINIHGEGKGGIVFEKVHLTIDSGFKVKKLDDGELHLVIKTEDSKSDIKVAGKVTIAADNVFIGKQEISAVFVNIVNENWEFLINSLGKPILDKSSEKVHKLIQDFLNKVPAKDLISDDLTSYAS